MIGAWRPIIVVALLLAVAATGCREGGPGGSGHVAAPERQKIRVAVMPFDAASQRYDQIGQVVAQEVVTVLVGSGVFEVVEPGAVYGALVELAVRNGYGLSPSTMEKLQSRVGPVDIFIVGMVQDFSDVQVGPAIYPAISLNARAIDGYSGRILWSGSTSLTGSDSEKVFGIGAVYSPGRLARAAVRDLVRTLDQTELIALIEAPAIARDEAGELRRPTAMARAPAAATGNESFFDESVTVSEADMRRSLVDVDGMVKGPTWFRLHHFSIAETTYDGKGTAIHVKLVDYRKADAALGYVKLEHSGETEGEFAGLPAYSCDSSPQAPGARHLDVAVGRFGLHVLGPKERGDDIERVARALIDAMA